MIGFSSKSVTHSVIHIAYQIVVLIVIPRFHRFLNPSLMKNIATETRLLHGSFGKFHICSKKTKRALSIPFIVLYPLGEQF